MKSFSILVDKSKLFKCVLDMDE